MVAQTVQAQSTADADLDRIRKALAETPAISPPATEKREGPVFRVTVEGHNAHKPAWAESHYVSAYVRPSYPSYHFEFLQQVTPETFRAPTLYPGGFGLPVDRLIGLLAKHIKAANGQRQEKNARQEVRRAFEAFLACRADPDRPGC